MLLVVDQFEELFTLCRDEGERSAFVANLMAAVAMGGPIAVVIALRADFYAHLAAYADLRSAVAREQEYIGPMTAEELRRTITGPAEQGDWRLGRRPRRPDPARSRGRAGGPAAALRTPSSRPGTVAAGATSDARRLRRGRRRPEGDRFHGGPAVRAGARRRRAGDRSPALTAADGAGRWHRRYAPPRRPAGVDPGFAAEATAAPTRVLSRLTEARLVTTGESTARGRARGADPRVADAPGWLSEDREGLRMHRQVTEAADQWEAMDRDPGALYRGTRLARAMDWAATHPGALNERELASSRSRVRVRRGRGARGAPPARTRGGRAAGGG